MCEFFKKITLLYPSDQVCLIKAVTLIQEQSIAEVQLSQLKPTREYIAPKEISKKSEPKLEIRGILPKGWRSETNSKELNIISENIQDEQQKIE